MTHPEAAIAALFDHEQELDHPDATARRRRRPAADWGGDDLFSSTPRRRRPRSHEAPERHLYAVPAPADIEWAPVALAVAVEEPEASAPADRFAGEAYTEAPPADGRRTVTITGHPEPRVVRTRRPAPTVDQRIGHRPDRIAGWAFALGMLLILIAILTAHMG
jgi:hypothetical protein